MTYKCVALFWHVCYNLWQSIKHKIQVKIIIMMMMMMIIQVKIMIMMMMIIMMMMMMIIQVKIIIMMMLMLLMMMVMMMKMMMMMMMMMILVLLYSGNYICVSRHNAQKRITVFIMVTELHIKVTFEHVSCTSKYFGLATLREYVGYWALFCVKLDSISRWLSARLQ